MADKPDDAQPAASAAPPSPVPDTTVPAAPAQADQAAVTPAPAAVDSSSSVAGAVTAGDEAKPEAVAAEAAPASEPTLLEKFDTEAAAGEKPAADAKPADKPGEPGAEKPGEAPKAEAAPLPPVDYFKDVKIPDAVTLDDAQRGEVSGALDLLRSGKHAEGTQKLFDLHAKTMQDYADQLGRDQWTKFNETRKGWVDRVKSDNILGGAGHNTAMATVARMRDMAMSSAPRDSEQYKSDQKDFGEFLRATGAGDHPAFLRLLHNFGKWFDEPALPPVDARPPPNPGRPAGESRRGRMYPTMNGDGR